MQFSRCSGRAWGREGCPEHILSSSLCFENPIKALRCSPLPAERPECPRDEEGGPLKSFFQDANCQSV